MPETSPRPTAPTRTRSVLRSAWRLTRAVLVGYLLMLLIMMLFEESLIFFPSKYPDGFWNPPLLDFEDAEFQAADGTRLHGWYVPCEQPRAVMLFAHGNAGNLSHRDDVLRRLHKLNVSVLIFDYRGYGRSEGSPTEAGVLQDARAARGWLARRAGVRESDLILMGESIGGSVMVDLAADGGARGLILENALSSLPDVAAHHYPWAPVRLLMRSELDSVGKIGRFHGPLLMIHGDADTIVPIEYGRRVFTAANEPKRFVVVPGGDHNDFRTPVFDRAIDQFLGELPPLGQ